MFLRNVIIVNFITLFTLFIFYKCSKTKQINKWRTGGILLICVTVVFIFTITGVTPLNGFHIHVRPGKTASVSFVPFHTIRMFLRMGINGYVIANLLGNVVMFVPFGFLLPMVFKKGEHWFVTVPAGFILSFIIEFSQMFLLYRGTDVDDLILNTIGCLIGYLLFLPLKFGKSKLYGNFRKPVEKPGWSAFIPYIILLPYAVVVLLGFWDRYYRVIFRFFR